MDQEEPQKSAIISKFIMTEDDDLQAELAEDEHLHVHGCCSCHNNVGK